MIYLNNIKANLTSYFNFSNSLTLQQKIVYTIACTVFAGICAFTIYRFCRACCLKKDLPPVDQKAQKAADPVVNQANQVPVKGIKHSFEAPKIVDAPKIEKQKAETLVPALLVKGEKIETAFWKEWTVEEIRQVNQAIPQWLLDINSCPEQEDFIKEVFKDSFQEIPDTATLDEHQTLFNKQIENCVNILGGHTTHHPKVPTLLRALRIPQMASDQAQVTYTFIMQQAWTKIVQSGMKGKSYAYTIKQKEVISEHSFQILKRVFEENKSHPQGAEIYNFFTTEGWKPRPCPKAHIFGFNLIIQISEN